MGTVKNYSKSCRMMRNETEKGRNHMDRRQRLVEIFEDTQKYYTENQKLAACVKRSQTGTKLYEPDDYPELEKADRDCQVTVTKSKSFEAAMILRKQYPEKRIGVLNFASATNPGGGVKKGSSAQEESLCRCSTLYPCLSQDRLWQMYYQKNRNAHDNLHTDAVIYSPDVVICKTDDSCPERMEDWVTVDVISCAAPNLRDRPANAYNADRGQAVKVSSNVLYKLHASRARHILHIAAANHIDILILGAFGCGAFQNDPAVVAKAYADVMPEYQKYFDRIEFAIYCRPRETGNYDAFRRILEKKQ